jgi:arylsulfatase A-like enzyme
MTRRATIAGAAAWLASRSMIAAADRPRGTSRPPSIVFILADDLGARDLSCYGRPDYRTPNIDRLCAEGVRLEQAYANSCTCSPTRIALLSGRYQNRLDAGNYDPLPPGRGAGFPTDHPTLASILRSDGYATGLVGKWHLGDDAAHGPRACGYDEFFGLRGSHIDYYSHVSQDVRTGATVADLYDNETLVDEQGYATKLFTDRALRFLERHRNRPFLLSLHYTAPHWPWQSPRDRGGRRLNDFHYDGGSQRVFAEMLASLDRGVGQVLAALRHAGLERDTIVVFTSDNGGERFSYHWPLRGAKFDLWEGGIRVPGIVRWPGRIRPRTRSDQVVLSMDWLPTLLAAAGASAARSHPPDGIDVLSAISGERRVLERTIFWRTQWSHAARRGPWKYLADRGHEYLFDLTHDEAERVNLKVREAQVFAGLKRAYDEWNAQMAAIPADALLPREFYERLEALEGG